MCEVVPVRHLEREDEPGQWCSKHRRHPRRRAADQHDPPVARFELQPQPLESRPQPRSDRAAAIDARSLQCGAAAEADGGDRGEQLVPERTRVDVALVLVVRLDDLLRGMAIRIASQKLHDQPGQPKAQERHRNDRTVMLEQERKYRGPDAVQDQQRDASDYEARCDPDQGRDQQPFLDVPRVSRGQILADQRRTLANQRVVEPSGISYRRQKIHPENLLILIAAEPMRRSSRVPLNLCRCATSVAITTRERLVHDRD